MSLEKGKAPRKGTDVARLLIPQLLLVTLTGTSWAAPLFRAAFLSLDLGAGPSSLSVGDLNGDGQLDLVTANIESNSVSVLLGNGDGTFAPKADFSTGSAPNSVAIGDLNGDGRPDLATANLGSNSVSVLLGNGDGTFGAKTDYGAGSYPQSVAVGDLNGDGRPDLATANGSGTVSVLLGRGDGSFGANTDYRAGIAPFSVAVGDLNEDGHLDLAMANEGSSTVSVLLGNGDGSFGPKTDYGTGDGPESVAIGDLNGDGRPDLATANAGSNTVAVLLQVGFPPLMLAAAVDLDPNVINLRSHAPWLTAYIEPSGFDPASIDVSTLRLAGSVTAELKPVIIGDHNADGIPDLMVKFSRQALDPLLTLGVNQLEVTGSLVTGEKFKGTGEVRVIDPTRGGALSLQLVSPLGVMPVKLAVLNAGIGKREVTVFDVQGRLVKRWSGAPTAPGYASWDGRSDGVQVGSGIYFIRVVDDARSGTLKVVVAR
jgi:hypothetical protein